MSRPKFFTSQDDFETTDWKAFIDFFPRQTGASLAGDLNPGVERLSKFSGYSEWHGIETNARGGNINGPRYTSPVTCISLVCCHIAVSTPCTLYVTVMVVDAARMMSLTTPRYGAVASGARTKNLGQKYRNIQALLQPDYGAAFPRPQIQISPR